MWEPAVIVAAPVVSLAVASNTGGFDVSSLIGASITPAIVIVLLLLGKLRTEPEVRRLEGENTLLRKQVSDKDAQMLLLQGGLADRAIPALTRSTLVLEALSPLLQSDDRMRRYIADKGDA